MEHLKETKKLKLKLSTDNLNISKWCIDASHAVHPDVKSHTGGSMTLGCGCICNMSRKQKLNTKSSAESKLAGVDDFVSPVLWTRCFLHAQGCNCDETVVCQDNTSAISLEKNVKLSGSKQTWCVNIRHHFCHRQNQEGQIGCGALSD